MKPSPADFQELYLESLARIGIDPAARHPLRRGRLGEPDARRLGPRLGGVVRRHGGDAVHLLPAGRRLRLRPGLRRDHLRARAPRHVCAGRRQRLRPEFQRRHGERKSPMATCSCRPSRNTRATISSSPTPNAVRATSTTPRRSARRCCGGAPAAGSNDKRHKLALPAYDQCIKASHIFNLLDARGVISVTERQSYILRVRDLAKAAAPRGSDRRRRGVGCHSGACPRKPAVRTLQRNPNS